MSLYVGHLSPRVRQEELERGFLRFGRCNLQLKDGYGFVVYEFTENAEEALQALRGKNICGEHITLKWSNRQPKPFQRSARPTRFYEPYRGRNFREEDNGVGIRASEDRRDFSTGNSRVPAYNRGEHHFDDVVDKEADHARKDIDDIGGKRSVNFKAVMDKDDTSETNPVENDRWGEPISDVLTGQRVGNGTEFDCYEPYQGYNGRDEKENNKRASSHGSSDRWSSQAKGLREHSIDETDKNLDKSKPQQTCYNRGIVSHMRNCSEGDARREKFSKFSHRRDEINFRDRGDGRLKMLRTNSWGRPNATRDPFISGCFARDRKESHYGKVRRDARMSESFPERREKRRPSLRVESQANKKSKQEHGTQKKALKKRRSRRFDTSSLSSDSSSSQSHSQSMKSTSRANSHSGSKSASSGPRSVSSSSRSASTSSYSKSNASRSRSRSSFLSLSVSFEEKPPSSPKNVHNTVSMSTSPKGNLDHVTSPNSKHHLPDNMESSELKDKNVLVSFMVDNENNGELAGHNGNDAHNSASIVGYKENSSCIDLLKDVAAASENCRGKGDLQGALPVKPNMQTSVGSEASNSTRITTQEMSSALKHYRLAVPEESEAGISIERYLGASRLWPWEMIYYRRLKRVQFLLRIMPGDLSRTKNLVLRISTLEAVVVGENANKTIHDWA